MTEYFVMVTLDKPNYGSASLQFLITPEPGMTRANILAQTVQDITEDHPQMAGANVTFFYAEPNRLTEVAS
jgi:hypothetical protein